MTAPYTAHVDTFARDNLPARELWPELLFDTPALQYPERLNCVVELLDKMVAAGHGDRPAIRAPRRVLTYSALLELVNRIARVLREDLGLVPGNRVLLRAPNNPMMAACWLAVVKAGLIAVATMPLLRARELIPVIERAKVNASLCDAALKEEMELARAQSPAPGPVLYFNTDAPGSVNTATAGSLDALQAAKPSAFEAADTAAEDVCIIAFTSGTTGVPKGTMHFHRDVLAICDCFPPACLQATPEDVFCGTPPLAFTFGLGGLLLFPLRVGASSVLIERLTPTLLLSAIEERRATICFTAPTFYRQMAPVAFEYDIASLKKCVSAGEALPLATRELWEKETGARLIDGIGATELLHIFISAAGEDIRPGATGKPVPGYRACVLDEAGKPLPPGRVGRLAVKGPTGCRYLADERQKSYVEHGWNLTGDAYLADEDGYFWYQARTDDMIVSAGYNIAGPEVEAALLMHPAVAECGVVGMPDPARGQIVKAVVVLREGFAAAPETIKALQDFVKQTVAPYKYPRAVEFRDALPRTETGKLQRFKLREG